VGFALFDSNESMRFFTDTLDENNTALTLVDSAGKPRTRLSAKGDMRTFDENGLDRFMVGEDGSLRILDGDVEAFAMNRYGLYGASAEGNVTMQFDRLSGTLATAGPLQAEQRDLKVEDLEDSYAQYCSADSYPNPAALLACDTPEVKKLIEERGYTPPASRSSRTQFYEPPSGVVYETGRGLRDAQLASFVQDTITRDAHHDSRDRHPRDPLEPGDRFSWKKDWEEVYRPPPRPGDEDVHQPREEEEEEPGLGKFGR